MRARLIAFVAGIVAEFLSVLETERERHRAERRKDQLRRLAPEHPLFVEGDDQLAIAQRIEDWEAVSAALRKSLRRYSPRQPRGQA
jgi:hypothetical protein